MFANLMSAADIGRLDPTRSLHNVDDFDRCSSIYHHHQPESGQHASIGVTYKWKPVLRQGGRCMRCFHTHHFAEAPLPNGSSTCPWSAQFIPGNCSESLAMAILEGTLDNKWGSINAEEESCTAGMVFNVHMAVIWNTARDINADEKDTAIVFAMCNCSSWLCALLKVSPGIVLFLEKLGIHWKGRLDGTLILFCFVWVFGRDKLNSF